jgi:hypothetical protein
MGATSVSIFCVVINYAGVFHGTVPEVFAWKNNAGELSMKL